MYFIWYRSFCNTFSYFLRGLGIFVYFKLERYVLILFMYVDVFLVLLATTLITFRFEYLRYICLLEVLDVILVVVGIFGI